MNNNNNQGNAPQGTPNQGINLVLQPAQIKQLAKQCNAEVLEARRLGSDTPEGREHLKKAQKIKSILVQYQQQQRQAQAQAQAHAQGQAQAQQQTQSSVSTPVVANAVASPQIQQAQQIPKQSPQLNQLQQQRPQVQHNIVSHQQQSQQPVPVQQQQQGSQMQNMNANIQGTRNAVSSPSPMSQAGTPSSAAQTSQAPRNPYQQLQQIKQVLANFQKTLKEIEIQKRLF
ncbi:hypothetical protein BN1211_1499 [Cyberlindnera jadinii]|uniref:Uncharacterized protein n=1 Tax=Cyberlindnera jadinii (strain ATCC 18201 / CBS 1600 / BCRC 20928 / JCM 3617 / NBRC 0987 / NRRL Y-1542) TaxID=983966 RepID=A0A0H5C0T9_CYBJN|nr:hypothetical protein BN1211_1499 [Cyberlindnera jadinii]